MPRRTRTLRDLLDCQTTKHKTAENGEGISISKIEKCCEAKSSSKRKMLEAQPTTQTPRRGIIETIMSSKNKGVEDPEDLLSNAKKTNSTPPIRKEKSILEDKEDKEHTRAVPMLRRRKRILVNPETNTDSLTGFMYEYFVREIPCYRYDFIDDDTFFPPTGQGKQSTTKMTNKWLMALQTPPFEWVTDSGRVGRGRKVTC
jgi:hypothetical protein